MKIYYKILFVFIIVGLSNEYRAQNFFPIGIGDQFQEEYYFYRYSGFGDPWIRYTYPVFAINDSLIYNNTTYYKYKNKYFAYDTLQQQLVIHINGESHLAVDFNQPSNTSHVIYFLGSPRIWKSEGIGLQNILGENRLVYTMTADTDYIQGPGHYYKEWEIKFAENVGIYNDYYEEEFWSSPPGPEVDKDRYTIILARIDTVEINTINKSISLIDSVRNRHIDEFPYILGIEVESSLPALISYLYAEYNIYRKDTLISTRIFELDRTSLFAFINIQPSELQVGDILKFNCVLKDTSMFFNERTAPDTGNYTIEVLPKISSVADPKLKLGKYKLFQNFPNPFNPITKIKFTVPHNNELDQRKISLKIYDIFGSEIVVLVNEEKHPGEYEVEFDGGNLPSGIYFYQMNAGNFSAVKKLVLLK